MCESPSSTAVYLPVGSPKTHGPWETAKRLAWHPSLDEEGKSPCACAGSGVRFLGARIVLSPAMMAVFISPVTVGVAVDAWTTVASAPVPTSDGRLPRTSTAATTAEPDNTRPPTNHCGVGSPSDRA